MGLWAIFITAWVVGFTGAMAPGPISALVINESGRRGFWAGPMLTLGHGVAEAAMVLALALGLQRFLTHPGVPAAIALVGGAVLMWMGLGTIRGSMKGRPATAEAMPPSGPGPQRWGSAAGGVVATLTNPYWFLWWSTVGASYVVVSLQHGSAGVAAFFFGHVLSDLTWNSLLAFLMASGRRWLPGRVMHGFLALTGVALVGLGVYFLLSGIRMMA